MKKFLKKQSVSFCILFLSFGFYQCKNFKNNSKSGYQEEQITFDMNSVKATVYTTAHNSNLKLTLTDTISFSEFNQPLETEIDIVVDPRNEFQEFIGIGAALTDASAETFYKLSKENQELFLQAYYDTQKGIGYSLARTIIHSCDFSSASYTYVEEGDKDLKSFSIKHDKKYRIPFTKKAIEAAGGKLTMYASPWSPPAFMKTNNNMLKGGKLKEEFYQPWANYYAKFIKAYEKEGIPIWGLSIQNEPRQFNAGNPAFIQQKKKEIF